MKKIKEKLRNLYSVHDKEDKSIALILAKSVEEAKRIWYDKNNHELVFITRKGVQKVRFKEIKKSFVPKRLSDLLSEKKMNAHKSFLCTKLSRYYAL